MMCMRTLYCIVLLCISGSLYSGRGPKKHMKRILRPPSLTQKYYKQVESKLLTETASSSKAKRLRKSLLQDAQLIITRNANHPNRCRNSIAQLKYLCSPSTRHAKRLIQFLNRPGALEKESLSPQASAYDRWIYNSAKAGCLIPILLHKRLLSMPNSSAAIDIAIIFADALKDFDIFAHSAQKDLTDVREKLLQKQQWYINEKLLTASQLLHNAQAQSKRMQEVLHNVRS